MALDLIGDNQDDNKKKQDDGQPGADQGAPAAGVAAPNPNQSSSAGAASNTQGGTSTRNKTGSGFVNLQKVLNANQNNQLGSTINSGITNDVNNVKSGLQNSVNDFNTQTSTNEIGTDQDKASRDSILKSVNNYTSPNVNTVGQGPNASAGSSNTGSSVATQAATPPTPDNILSADQIAQFQKYANANYQGPTALGNVDQLTSQAQGVQNTGANINKGQSGLQSLLQQYVGGAGYTSGQKNLDAAILGQTGAQDLRSARNSTYGLTDAINNQNLVANSIGGQKAQEAKDFATDTNNALYQAPTSGGAAGGAIGNLNTDLSTRLAKQNAANVAGTQAFQDRVKSGQLTMDDLTNIIPLLDASGTENVNNINLFGLTGNDFATAAGNGINQYNNVAATANMTDYAKENALAQLAGKNDLSSYGLNFDANQLNSAAGKSAFNFDPTKFSTYQTKNADLENAVGGLKNAQAQELYYQNDPASTAAINNLQNQVTGLSKNDPNYQADLASIYKNALSNNALSPQAQQYIERELYNPLAGISVQTDSAEANRLNNGAGTSATTAADTGGGPSGQNDLGAAYGSYLGSIGGPRGAQAGAAAVNNLTNGLSSSTILGGMFGGGNGPTNLTAMANPNDLSKYASGNLANNILGVQGQNLDAYNTQINNVNQQQQAGAGLSSLLSPDQLAAFNAKYPSMAALYANQRNNGTVGAF